MCLAHYYRPQHPACYITKNKASLRFQLKIWGQFNRHCKHYNVCCNELNGLSITLRNCPKEVHGD